MIGVVFDYFGEPVEFRVSKTQFLVRTSNTNMMLVPFSEKYVRFDYDGTVKQFPDLKDDVEWKQKASMRIHAKVFGMRTDDERVQYLIDELTKIGYVPLRIEKEGHRPKKVQGGVRK